MRDPNADLPAYQHGPLATEPLAGQRAHAVPLEAADVASAPTVFSFRLASAPGGGVWGHRWPSAAMYASWLGGAGPVHLTVNLFPCGRVRGTRGRLRCPEHRFANLPALQTCPTERQRWGDGADGVVAIIHDDDCVGGIAAICPKKAVTAVGCEPSGRGPART